MQACTLRHWVLLFYFGFESNVKVKKLETCAVHITPSTRYRWMDDLFRLPVKSKHHRLTTHLNVQCRTGKNKDAHDFFSHCFSQVDSKPSTYSPFPKLSGVCLQERKIKTGEYREAFSIQQIGDGGTCIASFLTNELDLLNVYREEENYGKRISLMASRCAVRLNYAAVAVRLSHLVEPGLG
jgi:hypothetical protein